MKFIRFIALLTLVLSLSSIHLQNLASRSWPSELTIKNKAESSRGHVHVVSEDAKIDIDTAKVAYITGTIDWDSLQTFEVDMDTSADLPGDRVIMINSYGGIVDAGEKMLDLMHAEHARGVRQVCVVTDEVSSMAFNILTECDVRLSTMMGSGVVHKIRTFIPPNEMMTAKKLRHLADELDACDEQYRQRNSAAMHLTIKEYDDYADNETRWSAFKLFNIHYLDGIAHIKR